MPTVSAVMPKPLVDALDLAAEREGKSRSAAIVAACERWCEVRGQWPPGGVGQRRLDLLLLAEQWMANANTNMERAAVVDAPGKPFGSAADGLRWQAKCYKDCAEQLRQALADSVEQEVQDG